MTADPFEQFLRAVSQLHSRTQCRPATPVECAGNTEGERCVGATTTLLAPRPVFYAHGTADSVVDISGANESVDALRRAWGLSGPELIEADEVYEIYRYASGGTGLIEHMQHDLRSNYVEEIFGAWEGHCFPGSAAPMGCGAGPAWGEAVLRFFEAHPKD